MSLTKNQPAQLQPLRQPPLRPEDLAHVLVHQLSNLPAHAGVYLAIDEANRVWYVGIAESLRDRLVQHDRLTDFKSRGVTLIAWKPEENLVNRRRLEKELIEYFHPPLNLQHNFNALPEIDFGLTPDEEVARYLHLRIQQKLIELQLETLKPNMVTRCEQQGGKINHSLGVISRSASKIWRYSERVELLKQQVKDAQEDERRSGSAVVIESRTFLTARLNPAALEKEVADLIERAERAAPDEIAEAV